MEIIVKTSDCELENGKIVYNTTINAEELQELYQDKYSVGSRYNTNAKIREICNKIADDMIELHKLMGNDE